jgi:primosomal protein N' (replication factor Y)
VDRGRKKAQGSLFEVAVMAAIPHPLTYRFPASLPVSPGLRVLVPLASRKTTGIVLGPTGKLAPGIEVREALRALDPEPVLSAELVRLGRWISDYYLAPPGEVFRAMLPLRRETRQARQVHLTEEGRRTMQELAASLLEESKGSQEVALLAYLDGRPGASFETLSRKFPAAFPRALEQKWVTVEEVQRERTRRKVFSVRLAGPVPERPPRLSPVARRIIEALERQGPAEDHRPLLEAARAQLANLRALSRAGLIELSEAETREGAPGGRSELRAYEGKTLTLRERDAPATAGEAPALRQPAQGEMEAPPTLTAAQSAVLNELSPRLDGGGFSAVLLHGVTGSGKTEVYLHLIARCLERGRSALMMVPEIALTPAMQYLFFSRFSEQVALLHSGLTERERDDAWWRVRRGQAKVVLGTRSAVFAPLANLGVVIVDEEHDSSYKQDGTPRYHGRDVAVVRAQFSGAVALLGSATPSLESYWNARAGKYHLLKLEERIAGRKLAAVEVVDMRQEFRETHTQVPFSRKLREEIEAQIRDSAQTMLLLNRRGYSWFLLCRSCGQTQRCVNCSVSLTYHRREHRLICHYCGYSTAVPSVCPACGSEYLHYVGEGTEKLEQKLAELFSGARVARLDRDVARRRGEFLRVLADFRQGKIDILVGTQLIAKGHDFPGVTLVGVVSADIGLGLPDFRAAERSFQLVTQVAGRAGRGDAPGRVLVQTFFPDHYAIRFAAEQNYEGFFSKEMGFRRLMHYPPITALANLVAQHEKLERAAQVAKEIGEFFSRVEGQFPTVKVLGPGPAPLAKVERRYRIQFLLKSNSRATLHALLKQLVHHCASSGVQPREVMIDVDPASIM